jgi:hypothetical protein
MRTAMELLSERLSSQGAYLVQNDPSIAEPTRTELAGEDPWGPDAACLHILPDDSERNLAALEHPGNYVIFCHFDTHLTSRIGKGSNVLKVSRKADLGFVERSAEACCEAASILQTKARELMGAASSPTPAFASCSLLAELIGNPVAVTTLEYRIVAISNPTGRTDDQWDKFSAGRGQVDTTTWPEGWRTIDADEMSAFFTIPVVLVGDYGASWLRCGIYSGKRLSYALLSYSIARPFTERDIYLAAAFSDMLGGLLNKDALVRSNPEQLLESILDGSLSDQEAIRRSADELGVWDKDELCLALLYDAANTTGYEKVMRIATAARHKLGGTVAASGLDVAVLFEGISATEAKTRLASFLEEDEECERWRAGLSFSFSDVAAIPAALTQCKDARRLGGRIKPCLKVQDFTYYCDIALIEQAANAGGLRRYFNPIAWSMVEYDQHNGTEYARTMYCFLKNLRRKDLIAKRLHVHRNTVLYRIDRISEIFGIDFDDMGTMHSLELAFDILLMSHPELELL